MIRLEWWRIRINSNINPVMKKPLQSIKAACLAVAAIFNIQQASAEVLIYDNFNRNGTLHGSTVDTGGLTWTSTGSSHNNTTTANGGQEIGGWNAKLPFTPETGKTYQLTLTAGPTIQNALQIAFGNKSGGFGDYNFLTEDVSNMAWVRIGAQSGGTYDFGNEVNNAVTTMGTYTLDADTGPGFVNTLDLILDTTGGLAAAQLTWKINGVTKGNWTADVTGYNSILFGRGTGPEDPNSTQISDLTLQTVELTATTTAVTYSPNPALLGNDVSFTATIDPGAGITNPTGTVQFKVDGVNFGTPVTVANGSGLTATATSSSINTLSLGGHTIQAIYSGNATYGASSGSAVVTINTGDTVSATALVSSLNPALRNDNITFTATVDPGVGITNPTGTVQFKVDGSNFGAPVAVSNGTGLTAVAEVSTSTLSPGTHEIEAIYSGDQTYTTSSGGPLTQTINLPPVPANLLFSDDFDRGPAPLHGSMPTLVNPAFYPTGVTWVSTGSNHNNTTTANGGQEIGGWNAKLPFTPQADTMYQLTLTVGPTIQNALQVAFGSHTGGFNDYNFLSQDVANMAWARIGSVDGGVYDFGTRVANVYSTAGTYTLDAETGPGFETTLDLLLDTTNGLSNAQLTWKINGVSKGTWTADVTGYNAIMFGRGTGTEDPNGTQISDLALQIVVSTTTTTTELVSSVNPSVAGQEVTFTATVKDGATTATDATGTITFKVDDTTAAVESVVNGQATFTTSALAAGSRTIDAEYSGDSAYTGSTGSLAQAVSASPYNTWAGPGGFNLAGGPDDDDDGDGQSNYQEFAFGLDPTSGASVNPVTDVSELATLGLFSYTRLAASGLTYTVWVSTDLQDWGNEPAAATEEAGEPDENGVQTVLVELNAIPAGGTVFVRVKAE